MYVRRTSATKATNDSGTSIQGRNAAASCKPIYTGIHLRRTICVSKEAMERLPLSNPEGSLMAAQHFEPGDFTFRNRFGRAASQKIGCGEEREAQPYESIIDHTKQSWYSSNATSALTLAAELNRSKKIIYIRAVSLNLEILRIAADTRVPRLIPAIPKIVTKITSEVNYLIYLLSLDLWIVSQGQSFMR
ncbi:Hypothetical_protein [Hexamita inflata]|uniref:Hypothetical_protein n=1 Tax=Hexamita inflata TaxID=28002 RepID=A0AA86TZ41_9EUKA|nr:Hypothetical protein HINF_LOCUS13443 [Hexamita inflata]